MDISDEKESVERDEISKNDDVTLTDVDEKSEEIDKINKKLQDDLESDKLEIDERK